MKQIFAILILTCIASTNGLRCYNCVYIAGLLGQQACQNNPNSTSVATCSMKSTYDQSVGEASYTESSPGVNADKFMCASSTGRVSFNGSIYDTVVRGCAFGPETDDAKCGISGYSWQIQNGSSTIRIDGLPTCLCSRDGCNGQNSTQTGVATEIQACQGVLVLTLAAVFKQIL